MFDAVAMQAVVKRRARQVRDYVLQGGASIIHGKSACTRYAMTAASSIGESTVPRRYFGPIGMSSPPLRGGLLVEPVPLREARDQSF